MRQEWPDLDGCDEWTEDLTLMSPLYEDWQCLSKFFAALESVNLQEVTWRLHLIDDASPTPPSAQVVPSSAQRVVRVTRLGRNLGHPRSIAVGLSEVVSGTVKSPIIVMDVDGEDRPQDVARLLAAHQVHPDAIIVAQRRSRSEGVRFQAFYRLFRVLFRMFTGKTLDFGNFVLLPTTAARRLVLMNELWSHFPAAIMRSGFEIVRVPTDRGSRYHGSSRMNFGSLVNHGLAAMAAFLDVVFVRLLVFAAVLFSVLLSSAVVLAAVSVWGAWDVPVWMTSAVGLTLLGILQLGGVLLIITFFASSTRANSSPPPISFAHQYVASSETFR